MAFNLTANLNVALNTGSLRNAVNQVNSSFNNASKLKLGVDRGSFADIGRVKAQVMEATDSIQQFGYQAGLAAKRFTAFTVTAGSIITLTQTMREAVSAAIDFDREMVKLAQVSNDSSAGVQSVANEITRLSTNFGVSSKDLLNVAITLKQANLSLKDTKIALEAMAQAALAPNFDNLKSTTEGAIAIMNQFGVAAKDLGGALGSVNVVAGEFAVEAGDIIEAVRKTGGAFKAAGGNLNELIALFTAVRQTTRESAETIGTGLRTIFTRIQRNDTAEALKQVGIQLRYTRQEALGLGDANLENQFVGPYEAIRRLAQGLEQLRGTDPRFSAIVEQLGGYRQISKVIPLIKEFGIAQKALGVAQAGQASLALNAAQAQDALAIKLTKLKEQFLEVGRGIVNSPGFRSLVDVFITASGAVLKLIDSLKGMLPLIAALGAIKIGKSLAGLTSGFLKGVSSGDAKKASGGFIRMKKGGVVPGSGNGDIVPALLEPGEVVIPRQKFAVGGKAVVDIQSLPYKRHSSGKSKNIGFNKIVLGLNKGKKISASKFEEEALNDLGGSKGKGRSADPNFPVDGILPNNTPVEIRNRISTTPDSVLASKLIGYKESLDSSFFEKVKNGKLKNIGKIGLVYNTGKLKRSEEYKKELENRTVKFKKQQEKNNKFFGGPIQKFAVGGSIKLSEAKRIAEEYLRNNPNKQSVKFRFAGQRYNLAWKQKPVVGPEKPKYTLAQAREIAAQHLRDNPDKQSVKFRFAGQQYNLARKAKPIVAPPVPSAPMSREERKAQATRELAERTEANRIRKEQNRAAYAQKLITTAYGPNPRLTGISKLPTLGFNAQTTSATNPLAARIAESQKYYRTLAETATKQEEAIPQFSFLGEKPMTVGRKRGQTTYGLMEDRPKKLEDIGTYGLVKETASTASTIKTEVQKLRKIKKEVGNPYKPQVGSTQMELFPKGNETRPDIAAKRNELLARRKKAEAAPNDEAEKRRKAAEIAIKNQQSLGLDIRSIQRERYGFASGGLVPGVGNSDTVPMNLPEGSFVIRKSSVNKIGADRLAKMGRYASGGSVPSLLTPGEYVFSPKEASRIGASKLHSMNKFAKFAEGGNVSKILSSADFNSPEQMKKIFKQLIRQIINENPTISRGDAISKAKSVMVDIKAQADKVSTAATQTQNLQKAYSSAEKGLEQAQTAFQVSSDKLKTLNANLNSLQQQSSRLASAQANAASQIAANNAKLGVENARLIAAKAKEAAATTPVQRTKAAADRAKIEADILRLNQENAQNLRVVNAASKQQAALAPQITQAQADVKQQQADVAGRQQTVTSRTSRRDTAKKAFEQGIENVAKAQKDFQYDTDETGNVTRKGRIVGTKKPMRGPGTFDFQTKEEIGNIQGTFGIRGNAAKGLAKQKIADQYQTAVYQQLKSRAEQLGKQLDEAELQAAAQDYTEQFQKGRRKAIIKDGQVVGDVGIGQKLSKGSSRFFGYKETGEAKLGTRIASGAKNLVGQFGVSGAVIGANYLAGSMQASAPTAEATVKAGVGGTIEVNKAAEASMKSMLGFGGALEKGANYAATAGAALASFGPQAAAAGAAIGGLIGVFEGFTTGVLEAERRIRQQKIATALENLQGIFERVGSGLENVNDSIANSIKRNQEELAKQSTETAFDVAGGNKSFITRIISGFTGGGFGGFNAEEFNAQLRKSQQQNLASIVVPLTNTLNKFAEDIGKQAVTNVRVNKGNVEGLNFEDFKKQLTDQFKNQNQGFGKEQIRQIAIAKNISLEQASKEFEKVIQESFNAEKLKQVSLKAIAANERTITSMQALSNAVSAASFAADKFSSKLETNTDLFEGKIGSLKLPNFADQFSTGTPDLNAFNAAISDVSISLGVFGKQFREQGNAINIASQALPDILAGAVANPISGQDVSTQISDGLREALKQRGVTGGAAEAVVSSVAGATSGQDYEKLLAEAGGDVGKLSQKLLSGISEPLLQAFKDISSKTKDAGDQYIQGLTELANRQKSITESYAKLDTLRLQSQKFAAKETARAMGMPSQAGKLISYETATQGFRNRQQRLTGFGPAAAEDPRAIATRLGAVQQQILAQEEKVKTIPVGANKGADFRGANQELTRLKLQASSLTDALKNLTDQSELAAAAEDELSQIRSDRETQTRFGEKLLTSGPEELQKLGQGQQLLNIAQMQGGQVGNFSVEARKTLFEFLDNFGEAGKDVKDSIIQTTLGIPKQVPREQQLVSELSRIYATQEQSQQLLIQNQQALQQTYFSNLDSRNEKFYSELEKFTNELQKSQMIAERGREQQKLSRIKDVQQNADFLQKANITKPEEFNTLVSKKGTVLDLAKAQKEVQSIRQFQAKKVDVAGIAGNVNNIADARINLPNIQTKLLDAFGDPAIANQIKDQFVVNLETGKFKSGAEALQKAIDVTLAAKLQNATNNANNLSTALGDDEIGKKLKNLAVEISKGEIDENKFNRAIDGIRELQLGVGQDLSDAANAATGRINELTGSINNLGGIQPIKPAQENKQFFATGGSVFKARGTDTVPAMLTPGEFVVNKNATSKNLGLLRSINNGTNYLAEGGFVGSLSDFGQNVILPYGVETYANIEAQKDLENDDSLAAEMSAIDAQINSIKEKRIENILKQAKDNAPNIISAYTQLKDKYKEGRSTVTALGEKGRFGTYFSNIFNNRNLLATALQQMGGWGGIAGDYSTYIANFEKFGFESIKALQGFTVDKSTDDLIASLSQKAQEADSKLTNAYNQIAPQGREMPISPLRMTAIMDVIDGKQKARGSIDVSGEQLTGNIMLGAGFEVASTLGPAVALKLLKAGKLASIASKIPGLQKILKTSKTPAAKTVADPFAAMRASSSKPPLTSRIGSGITSAASTTASTVTSGARYGAQAAVGAGIMSGGANYFPSKPKDEIGNKKGINVDEEIVKNYDAMIEERMRSVKRSEKFDFNANVLDAIGSYLGYENSKNINVWKQNPSYLKVQELHDILTQKLQYDPVAPDNGTNLISSIALSMKAFDGIKENLEKEKQNKINEVVARKKAEAAANAGGILGDIKEKFKKFQEDQIQKEIKTHNILMREGKAKKSTEIQSEIEKNKQKQSRFVKLGLAAESSKGANAGQTKKLAQVQDAYFLSKTGNAEDMANILLQRQAQAQTILGVLQTYQNQPNITKEDFSKISPEQLFASGEIATKNIISGQATGIDKSQLEKINSFQQDLISSYLTLQSFQNASSYVGDDFIGMMQTYSQAAMGDPQTIVEQILKDKSKNFPNDIASYEPFVKANALGKVQYVKIIKALQKNYKISDQKLLNEARKGKNVVDKVIDFQRRQEPSFIKSGLLTSIGPDGMGFANFGGKENYPLNFNDALFQSVIPQEFGVASEQGIISPESIQSALDAKQGIANKVNSMMSPNQFLSLFNPNGSKTISRFGSLGFSIDRDYAINQLLSAGGLFQITSNQDPTTKEWKRFVKLALVENPITSEEIKSINNFIRNYKGKNVNQPKDINNLAKPENINASLIGPGNMFGITEDARSWPIGKKITELENTYEINDALTGLMADSSAKSIKARTSINAAASSMAKYFKFREYASMTVDSQSQEQTYARWLAGIELELIKWKEEKDAKIKNLTSNVNAPTENNNLPLPQGFSIKPKVEIDPNKQLASIEEQLNERGNFLIQNDPNAKILYEISNQAKQEYENSEQYKNLQSQIANNSLNEDEKQKSLEALYNSTLGEKAVKTETDLLNYFEKDPEYIKLIKQKNDIINNPLYRNTGGGVPSHRPNPNPSFFKPKGTDTVPAMLTPGEFVVRRSAAQANLPLLQAINSGNYFANGGNVKTRITESGDKTEQINSGAYALSKILEKDIGIAGSLSDKPGASTQLGIAEQAIKRIGEGVRGAEKQTLNFINPIFGPQKNISETLKKPNELETLVKDNKSLTPEDAAIIANYGKEKIDELYMLYAASEVSLPPNLTSLVDWAKNLNYLATGGSILGTDTIPAMLTPGEFVINKNAVNKIGTGFLNQINNVKGYANGGLVSYLQNGSQQPVSGNSVSGMNFPTIDFSQFDQSVQDFNFSTTGFAQDINKFNSELSANITNLNSSFEDFVNNMNTVTSSLAEVAASIPKVITGNIVLDGNVGFSIQQDLQAAVNDIVAKLQTEVSAQVDGLRNGSTYI